MPASARGGDALERRAGVIAAGGPHVPGARMIGLSLRSLLSGDLSARVSNIRSRQGEPVRETREPRMAVERTLDRPRSLAERGCDRPKNARRIAAGDDQTAARPLGFVAITSPRLWLGHAST
jgi:hypothetical protein